MTNENEKIKEKFAELIASGTVNAHIEGPKDNVLVCDSMNDWAIACGELCRAGFNASSPGGFGGSHPIQRQTIHNKIWRSGTICASVIERKLLLFSIKIPLTQTENDYCHIHNNKNIDNVSSEA